MEYFAHATAVIDDGATIGNGSKVWHFSHVSATSTLGKNCSLGQNVYVGNNVTIGNNVKIQNNVSVYEGVELADDVFCGPSMVFTNVYNPRSQVVRKSEYRSTSVKKGVTIGANATIICGITIGEFAFIGAGSVIKDDVKPYAIMVGVPAKQVGWMCICGLKLHEHSFEDIPGVMAKMSISHPQFGIRVKCQCGKFYEFSEHQCYLVE